MARKKEPGKHSKTHTAKPKNQSVAALNQRILDLEKALEHAQTQIDSAAAKKIKKSDAGSQFLGRMSHEIRTPINAIIGMVHLIRDTPLSKQQQHFVDNIDSASQNLLTTIDDIVDCARLRSNTLELHNDHFNLDLVLKSLANQVQALAEIKGLEVLYHVDPAVPQFLRGDANRIRQVLVHLLDNAINFTAEGHVQLQVAVQKKLPGQTELAFTISDTGASLVPGRQAHLYDVIHNQANSSSPYDGRGLGLSICRQLIERMDGQIELKSNVSEGTEVRFTIICDDSQIGAQTIRENPERFSDLRTLIVDSNPLTSSNLTQICEHLKMSTECVTTLDAAVQRLQEQENTTYPFQLVLMEYRIPNIDGLIASKLIKENRQLRLKPKVILLSAYHQKELFGQQRPDYIDSYLHKPVTHSSLFDCVSEVFGTALIDLTQDVNNQDSLAHTHILLVEDNIVNQKVAEGLLKRRGAKTTIANHGREALELLEQPNTFNLILMDMDMPVLNGYDTTAIIRSDPSFDHIPIIAMTAHVLPQDRERCLNTGMNDYLTKPVNPELLYSTILEYLQPHSNEEDL